MLPATVALFALLHPPSTTLTRRAVLAAGPLAASVALVPSPPAFAAATKLPSGLQVIDVEEGAGATPQAGQNVSVHYTGWLDGFGESRLGDGDSVKKFDSSYDRRKPLTFAVGTGRVIKGWDEALLSMKVGGKRRVIIPPELGYGERGAGGIIPPGATLYFDMELLSIL